MRENKSLIVYKESFFVKLKNFFKNIFDKKNSKEIHHELAENLQIVKINLKIIFHLKKTRKKYNLLIKWEII